MSNVIIAGALGRTSRRVGNAVGQSGPPTARNKIRVMHNHIGFRKCLCIAQQPNVLLVARRITAYLPIKGIPVNGVNPMPRTTFQVSLTECLPRIHPRRGVAQVGRFGRQAANVHMPFFNLAGVDHEWREL